MGRLVNVCYVTEVYTDELSKLCKGITYHYGDEEEAKQMRRELPAFINKLVLTRYLDEDMNILSIKRAG